ncbi:MAG: DUF1801 domain-containing protein [Fulvivirga sp.]|uniref:YdeI/OmpD-associated family protein n=1 Tax=Fulvivirga sp. TaxID=1931237 RepID=UPI0032EFEB3B
MSADEYINLNKEYKEELTLLRGILLSCGLKETIKWGMPVYTIGGKNIVGMSSFKSYFGLWFFQGALLKDSHNVLVNAQEGKTKAMRQWRFTNSTEVDEDLVKSYVMEAIKNQKAGREIKPERMPLIIPDLLVDALNSDESLKKAFEKLTLSKQREFATYIKDAKQEQTKLARLKKIKPYILSGTGLNDKYKK